MTFTKACHVYIVPKLVSRVSGKGGWGLKCTAYSSISDLYINAMFLLAYFDLVVIIQFLHGKIGTLRYYIFPGQILIFCSMGTKSSLSLTLLKRDHFEVLVDLVVLSLF